MQRLCLSQIRHHCQRCSVTQIGMKIFRKLAGLCQQEKTVLHLNEWIISVWVERVDSASVVIDLNSRHQQHQLQPNNWAESRRRSHSGLFEDVWMDRRRCSSLLQQSNCGAEYTDLAAGGNSVFKGDLAVHNMSSGAARCSYSPHKKGSLCQEADNTLLIPPHCSSGSWSWYKAENSKVV